MLLLRRIQSTQLPVQIVGDVTYMPDMAEAYAKPPSEQNTGDDDSAKHISYL